MSTTSTESEKSAELALLQKTVRKLRQQNELLANKFFVMQEYLIRSSTNATCRTGDPMSSLFPVESMIKPKASTTVFAFAGMHTRLSIPTAEFLGVLRGYDASVYLVKDFRQAWYHGGLLGISDSLDSTADYLKGLVQPGNQIITIGASAGGYAAIVFGRLLQANMTLAFAPQTQIDAKTIRHFRSVETQDGHLSENENLSDLQKFLQKHKSFSPIHIHYSKKNPIDSVSALHLTNCTGVELFAHDHDDHNVVAWLRDNGQLEEILSKVLTLPATDSRRTAE